MKPLFIIVCVTFSLSLASAVVAQDRIIELQVQADPRAPVGTQQRWMESLQDVGADRVVVKSGTSSTASISETKLASTTLVSIVGIIDGNRLHMPGGVFAITDKGGMKALIQQIRDDGAQVALADKKAFGLTSEQLVELHQTLSKPLDFETKGVAASRVVAQISNLIGTDFQMDATTTAALATEDTVAEELKGLSAGTALAAAIRPFGLVLEPTREQGKPLQLKIVDAQASDEHWPIGWPLDGPPVAVEPKLFDRLALEIRGFPLGDALNAIEQRAGVRFLYDRNAMAREGVDLSKSKATVVANKISYMVAIGKLLSQSKPKLIEELRVDENGKPFLWITTQ